MAQVSIAEQLYHPETNTVDFTFQLDPGPVVVIYARGYHISRGILRKEIPVYEENAVDDDLLNEGKRNLLDYLQTRGHFDAKVEIQKETDPKTLQVIYQIDPGPLHKLVLVEITGNKNFLDTAKLRSYLQIQPPGAFSATGATARPCSRRCRDSRRACIGPADSARCRLKPKWTTTTSGSANKLAVHIHIEEGVRTLVGEVQVLGTQKIAANELPELSTAATASLIPNRIWRTIGRGS